MSRAAHVQASFDETGDSENHIENFFWCPLEVENRKLIIYDYLITWTDYRVLRLRKVCQNAA